MERNYGFQKTEKDALPRSNNPNLLTENINVQPDTTV